MSQTQNTAATSAHHVEVRRVLDAPRERVWRAWTVPEDFAEWFGTPPFTTPPSTVAMDVRPGGEWRATQVSAADGTELPFAGIYREVREPEVLVFTFEDPTDRTNPAVEVATVTLREVDGKTEMLLHQHGHLPEEQYPRLAEGYSRFFDRLEAFLARS